MEDNDTELRNLRDSHSKNYSDRASWSSTTSENSNAQTTLNSSTGFTNNAGNSSKINESNQELIDSNNLPNLISRKRSFQPLSSKHTGNEQNQKNALNSSSEPVKPRPNLFNRLINRLPAFSQFRKTVKASVALLIASIFIFDLNTRKATGDSVLLVAIVVIFYFPVRTIGVQTEAVVLGTLGALLAAAWSFLGTYLASLARDKSDPNPIQVPASVVLAVFLFSGTFVVNLIRMKMPKANFGTVNACILLNFTTTYCAAITPFAPYITWLFLRPIAIAGGISLLVNYFLWPDDSLSNFIDVLKKTLSGYNSFFKEQSDAFLSPTPKKTDINLPGVKAKLQNGFLLLVDCKRALKREILLSRLSDKDCSHLVNAIKGMRRSLHGIGLSVIVKDNYLNSDTRNLYFKHFKKPCIIDAFTSTVDNIRPVSAELTDLCIKATSEASSRIGDLHYPPRTTLNSILWPFPRLWISKPKSNQLPAHQSDTKVTSQQIKSLINRFDNVSKSETVFMKFLELNPADIPRNGPLHLIYLYIHNLKKHATEVSKLLELVESLEEKRTHSRLWFPHQKLKKWILSGSDIGTNINIDTEDYQTCVNNLARVSTRPDNSRDENPDQNNVFESKKSTKRNNLFADPDVSAPVTTVQKFFYRLYLFGQWISNHDTFFALKTSIGVVLLAIPAWRTQDHTWYMEWRGQWAMITLVLWSFPMTGRFVFGIIERVGGSILGSVAAITVWEICQGNPYALSVVCFICYLPLYHAFFFIPKYRVAALMTKITLILVVAYEYAYVLTGLDSYDKVWVVAGKRLLMVIIGIAASGVVISIPLPPTSRVELRKRIAYTIRDIGKAYGIVSASAISSLGHVAHPAVVKAFGKLALGLRRQVAEERTLLHDAKYEPPLRGYFPEESYNILVEKMDNMADLVINMGDTLHLVRPEWRRHIGSILMKERKEYLSSVLTNLKLLSSTLSVKTSLPPYMISPVESRQRFVNLLEKKIMIGPKDLADPSFPSYSAYTMNSLVFVDELQTLLTVIEELVGVEDPEEWLISRV